jgi:hypothetical protein
LACQTCGVGPTGPECKTADFEDHTECVGDDIYWFDSCGAQAAIATDCLACQTCITGSGGPFCQADVLDDHLECNLNDVWQFDSCDAPVSIYDDCGTNEECVDEIEPPECDCLPGWVGLDCNVYVCDGGGEDGETCGTAHTVGRDELPITITGDTAAAGVDPNINVACGGVNQPGHDLMYRVYLFAGEVLDVTMDPTDVGDDLSVSAFFDPSATVPTCSTTTLLDCDDSGGNGAPEYLTIVAVDEGWYEIVVDANAHDNGGQGLFTLSLSIDNPVAGECYDGAVTPCEDQAVLFDWAGAAIAAPMVTNVSGTVDGMTYIYTSIAFSGTAIQTFDIPCDGGTWYMWGLRWKPSDALASFQFQVDGLPTTPIVWDISGGADWNWAWDQANGDGSMTPVWSSPLTVGTHTLTILGGASNGVDYWNHPTMGYIIITNDPAFAPPAL